MQVTIRKADSADAAALVQLLEQLGYPGAEAFIRERLLQLGAHPDERILVAQAGEKVAGFLSLHFIPQLGLAGDLARISYLCVADGMRSQGVGERLVAEAEALARERGCDRMEVHCHQRRMDAHRFYNRLQYQESPKYLIKMLSPAGD